MQRTITKALLDELVYGKPYSENERTVTVVEVNSNGEFSPWRFMDRLTPRYQYQDSGKSTAKKKKIIFCNALAKLRAPNSEDLRLISQLIKYYDVYLWPGDKASLVDITPVKDTDEFWTKVTRLPPVRSTTVKEALAEQGLDPDDYKIVDYSQYKKWIEALNIPQVKKAESQNRELVLSKEHINSDKLSEAQLVDASLEEGALIFAKANKDVDTFKKYSPNAFSKVTRFKLDDLTVTPSLLYNLRNKSIEFQNTHFDENVHLEHDYPFLRFENIDEGAKHIYAKDCHIEELHLLEGNCTHLDLSKASNQKLIITKSPIIVLSPSPMMTSLELNNCLSLRKLNTSSLDALESLKLVNTSPDLMVIMPRLKNLSITISSSMGAEFDFSQYPSLEELNLKGISEISFVNYNAAKPLRKIKVEGVDVFDLSRVPGVVEVEITCKSDTKIGSNPSIKKYNLGSDKSPNTVNDILSAMPNLVELNRFVSTDDIETINLSLVSQLKYLSLSCGDNVKEIQFVGTSSSLNTLILQNYSLGTFDLAHFSNLTHLEINGVAEFKNVNGTIKKLILNNSSIKSLDLSHFPNLEELSLSSMDELTHIRGDLSKLKKITIINTNKLSVVDLSSFTGDEIKINHVFDKVILPNSFVEHVEICAQKPNSQIINANNIGELGLIGKFSCEFGKNIKSLTLYNNGNQKIDLTQCTNIEELVITDTGVLENVELPVDNSLKKLSLDRATKLAHVSFDSCPYLESVHIIDCGIETFDMEKCKNLKTFVCSTKGKHSGYNFKGLKFLKNLKIADDSEMIGVDLRDTSVGSMKLESKNDIVIKADRAIEGAIPHGKYQKLRKAAPLRPVEKVASPPITDEKVIQTEKNRHRTVSFFNEEKEVSLQKPSSQSEIFNGRGDFKVDTFSLQEVDVDNYRMNIYDKIVYENGKLKAVKSANDIYENVFLQPERIDAPLLEKLKYNAIHHNKVIGSAEVTLSDHNLHALPIMFPLAKNGIQIYAEPNEAVEVQWVRHKQQFFFKIKDNFPLGKVKLCYQYQKNDSPTVSHQLVKQSNLLPNSLVKDLEAFFEKNPKFQFLVDKQLSTQMKLDFLFALMKEFEGNADLVSQVKDDFQILTSLLSEGHGKGACLERSIAYMAIAHFLDVPVMLNTNEMHAFVEIPYKTTEGQLYIKQVDLGGADAFDLTPASVQTSLLGDQATKAASLKAPVKEIVNPYIEVFEKEVAEKKINKLQDLHLPTGKQPLIILKPGQTAFEVNKQITQLLGDAKYSRHLYIDRPQDLEAFLNPLMYENGDFKKSFYSPLRDMINNGGCLVINWANFSPGQLVAYATLLEKDPSLLGEKVSKKLQIIGIIKESTVGCSAFYTRCRRCRVEPAFFKQPKASVESTITKKKLEIDLFSSASWRDLLLGKIQKNQDTANIKPGDLITAIEKGYELIIHNPPNDPSFDLLMHRVRDERKLFYNGELLLVHDHFHVTVDSKVNPNHIDNVRLIESAPTSKRIYLGIHNLYECYGQAVITHGKSIPGSGLLDAYHPENDVLYITGYIPENEWQRLLNHIQINYKTKPFKFILAPGAEIENVAKNPMQMRTEVSKDNLNPEKKHQIITTNDTDFVTNRLLKNLNDPLIIDLTPQMTMADLLYDETQTKPDKYGKVSFHFTPKAVLNALREGRNVILNGPLSPTLYKQLLPYLDPNAKIIANDETIAVKGKLYLVLPEELKNKIDIDGETNYHYRFDDYRVLFNNDLQDDLGKIEKYYQFVMNMPHDTLGRPVPQMPTYQKILLLLDAMKTKRHKHNYLKDVLLYDYPKHTEDYAYLNVLAKYFISPVKESSLNEFKLDKLKKRFNLASTQEVEKHFWKILNCYNGPTLFHLLALCDGLREGKAVPTPKAIEELFALINHPKVSQSVPLPEKPAIFRDEKLIRSLKKLLDDPGSFLIILKGEPGVGKTYTFERLGIPFYEGEDDIIPWLENAGNLLLDEGNMRKAGVWDFFKGLTRDKKAVYYKGKEYVLTEKHKLIMTGNPEDYPERHYHQFFQDYGKTLYYSKPNKNYLEEIIVKPLLQSLNVSQPDLINNLLKAYETIPAYNPFHMTSIRDLENLCLRFATILHLTDPHVRRRPDIVLQSMLQACIYEFSGSIKDEKMRAEFIHKLEQLFSTTYIHKNKDPLIYVTPTHDLPATKANMFDAINLKLIMRGELMDGRSYLSKMKKMIIIEGESGVGKTALFKAMIERRIAEETSKIGSKAAHARWQYVEINALTTNVLDTLIDAVYNQKIIILNEINLDKDLEKLMNHLLDGHDKSIPANMRRTDLSQEEVKKRLANILILASQNPGSYEERKGLSYATTNRAEVYRFNLSDEDRLVLAKPKVADHLRFVEAMNTTRAKYPRSMNDRTFFSVLTSEQEKQNKKPK